MAGLPLLLPPEHYETVQPLIAQGAKEAGRQLEELDLAACIWVSVAKDQHAAEMALRQKIAYYGHALSPLIWDRLGVTQADFQPIERAAMSDNDLPRAAQMVTPEMLKIGVVGSPQDIIKRLEPLVAQGVRHLSFGPPLGADPLEAIEVLGRDVLPYFK